MTQKQPHSRTYLIEATLMVVFILGPAVSLAFALDAKSGSIADWVAALATAGALGAAVAAARYAKQTLVRADERDVRAQAELVAAWQQDESIVVRSANEWISDLTSRVPGKLRDRVVTVAIRNASELPVYRVALRVGYPGEAGASINLEVLAPSPAIHIVTVDTTPLDRRAGFAKFRDSLGTAPRLEVTMAFTDAANRQWLRDENGTLDLVPSPPTARSGTVTPRR